MAAQYDLQSSEYTSAFQSVRCAKNVFWWLILLSLAVQGAAFGLTYWGGLVDAEHAVAPTPAATETATQPTGAAVDEKSAAVEQAEFWSQILFWALPATKFLAFVSALLLTAVLLLAVLTSLVGRLGGVAGLTGAMLWSLVLLAMVTPWQQALRTTFACGALYNMGDLIQAVRGIRPDWGAANVKMLDQVLFHARFLGYPVLTLLVWLVVQVRFARGYRNMDIPPIVKTASPASPGASTEESAVTL